MIKNNEVKFRFRMTDELIALIGSIGSIVIFILLLREW